MNDFLNIPSPDSRKHLMPAEYSPLSIGQTVTVSPGLSNGDCSYSYGMYEVVAVNNSHAKLKLIQHNYASRDIGQEVFVIRANHRFSVCGPEFLNPTN